MGELAATAARERETRDEKKDSALVRVFFLGGAAHVMGEIPSVRKCSKEGLET